MIHGSRAAGMIGMMFGSEMDINELENALRTRQRGQLRERATLIGCLALLAVSALVVWLRWKQ